MAGDELMSIGMFARRSRLSPKALRLYEAADVLVPASVDPANGYRRYRVEQLQEARLVRLLRRLGMPLEQIRVLVHADPAERGQLLARYWAGVEAEHSAQRHLSTHLRFVLSPQQRSYDMFDVHVREVAEQVLITEQRHVRVDELPRWIGQALGRQHRLIDAAGTRPAGPSLVIYHGEVSEDSDGPVEACTPVDDGAAAHLDAATRTESAHREAFTTITKAQVAYPQILSAYDAVEAWVKAGDHVMTGSPREVYFADFDAAGPDDPVADIAFPIQ